MGAGPGSSAGCGFSRRDSLGSWLAQQSHDRVPDPNEKGYMINVASDKNGVGYGKWKHIDGWSESVLDYIYACEELQ